VAQLARKRAKRNSAGSRVPFFWEGRRTGGCQQTRRSPKGRRTFMYKMQLIL